jgi:hypothetical protein
MNKIGFEKDITIRFNGFIPKCPHSSSYIVGGHRSSRIRFEIYSRSSDKTLNSNTRSNRPHMTIKISTSALAKIARPHLTWSYLLIEARWKSCDTA